MYPVRSKIGLKGRLFFLWKSKPAILPIVFSLLLFLLCGPAQSQPPTPLPKSAVDTVDIAVSFASAYPGTDTTWVGVMMRNQVAITGYHFIFHLSNPNITRFCQNGGSTWSIDTTGIIIPPSPNYQQLLRLCVGVCCVPDSLTDRISYVLLDDMSWLEGEDGHAIPFFFHQGELEAWWSVPGDANIDSLVDVGDLVFLTNYLYRGGTEPCVCEAADCNHDCLISVSDVVYLINYLYKGGLVPVAGCVACPHQNCGE